MIIRKRFSTADLIIISMFSSLAIVITLVGSILHNASIAIPFASSFFLHTMVPALVFFACIATVRKTGTATLFSVISGVVALPLSGVPVFLISSLVKGPMIDGLCALLGDRAWHPFSIAALGGLWVLVGIILLYSVELPLMGMQVLFWAFLGSAPASIIFGAIGSLIGLKLGARAQAAVMTS